MWREFRIGACIVVPFVAVLVWASTQVTFLFHHPRTRNVRVEIDKRTGAAVVMSHVSQAAPLAAERQAAPVASGSQASVRVPETHFDFGTMDPLTMGRHEFVIFNDGSAPLKLRAGPTTCKCAISGLADNEVAPGGSTTATLEWNSGRELFYSHAGTIFTNDPAKESIELRISGQVRRLVGCDVPEIVLDSLEPGKAAEVERLIYSEVFDQLAIEDVTCGVAGFKWEARQPPGAFAGLQGATACQKLRLTIPANFSAKTIHDTIRVAVRAKEESASLHHLDLSLRATKLRSLAFYGSAIDEQGVISLGSTAPGEGKRIRLLAKVRDVDLRLENPRVTAWPHFLKAELVPHADGHAGNYSLTVELPDDVPPCVYQSNPIGRIVIDTGHPRIGSVELPVAFAVVPKRSILAGN